MKKIVVLGLMLAFTQSTYTQQPLSAGAQELKPAEKSMLTLEFGIHPNGTVSITVEAYTAGLRKKALISSITHANKEQTMRYACTEIDGLIKEQVMPIQVQSRIALHKTDGTLIRNDLLERFFTVQDIDTLNSCIARLTLEALNILLGAQAKVMGYKNIG